MITWNSDFSVGRQDIVEQHMELFRILNEMETVIQSADFNHLHIASVVEKLENYAKTHFIYEENLMVERNYPMLDEHTHVHNEFRVKLHSIYVLDIEKPMDFYYEMLEYLTRWWTEHILRTDKLLGNYLSC